jgi:predicted lactoylglutathione lyase
VVDDLLSSSYALTRLIMILIQLMNGKIDHPRRKEDSTAIRFITTMACKVLLFFKTFTKKEISDTSKNTEVIVALSVEGREKVDQMINNAIKAGGRESREPQDHGWMYGRSFEDIDGHLWEIIYMDESAMKNGGKPS